MPKIKSQAECFQHLVSWSLRSFPHLPWRKKRTLFRTLVSEIMLQQTTVPTVLNHFERFLKRFPNLESLAQASEEELVIAWKGLGYYRRARNLRLAAQTIVEDYSGNIPRKRETLLTIPGIGPYTSSALYAIGMNKKALALDANLERVLSRFYLIDSVKGLPLKKDLMSQYETGNILSFMGMTTGQKDELLGPRNITEALMDLGREVCTARKANCSECMLAKSCGAYLGDKVDLYPVVDPKEKKKAGALHQVSLIRVLVRKSNKILVYKKSEKEWLSGQWEVPTFILKSEDDKLVQYPKWPLATAKDSSWKLFKTGITKYRLTNYVWEISEKTFLKEIVPYLAKIGEGKGRKYILRPLDIENDNFATSVPKMLKAISKKEASV